MLSVIRVTDVAERRHSSVSRCPMLPLAHESVPRGKSGSRRDHRGSLAVRVHCARYRGDRGIGVTVDERARPLLVVEACDGAAIL